MIRLCLNSRDELLIIELDKVAFFQAEGNYTRFKYLKGETHLITIGISKVEELIRKTWPVDTPSPFVRLGRSLIINQTYLSEISVVKSKIILSDRETNQHVLTVPKPLLKEYKGKIYDFFLKKVSND